MYCRRFADDIVATTVIVTKSIMQPRSYAKYRREKNGRGNVRKMEEGNKNRENLLLPIREKMPGFMNDDK